MAYFAVVFEVNNLLVRSEGSDAEQLLGCFCTRYLDATDADAAISMATEAVVGELNSQGIACSSVDVVVESVEQVFELPDAGSSLGEGFTFYSGDA